VDVADGVSQVAFRLLGPVEVWVGGRCVDAGRPRQRAVLAALLVDAGRVVPVDTLIARVWGQVVPEQARATLQTHLSRIRRLLEQLGECGVAAGLSRVSGGYVLEVDSDQIDLHLFRRLAGAGRGGGVGCPVESLRAGLALWRGQPLAGIEGEWAGRMRELWCRERVEAAVAWARAELAEANPGPVLAGLGELAGEHPLVESLTEVLMLALHAAGRTSDALDLYARTRTHLAEELGTDPGPDLQGLHRSLLRGEVTVPAVGPVVGPSGPAPRQLPAPPQLFTGRTVELAELDKIHDVSTVVITAIDGMAGVGKTALAVQAAHLMADRYPDGQLFVDLHGYTEGVAPVEPGAALDGLLRALGVGGERIPAELDQRAGLYRSRLAERRMVIVLDNAVTEAQVRPLLPGAPGCVVLVTSRRQLAGLDHSYALSLDTLAPADAVALLRNSAGEGRLAGQPPQVAAELVELCGRLPLAIRIAAARLRSHPAWGLVDLVRRLRDGQHRLAELQAGSRSVTAALDLSYQDLAADQQRAYRRMGLHFGADIDAYAAAALFDTGLVQAGQLLEQLLEAHLLQEPTPGRYRFHDLTRAHAADTATREETDHSGQTALDRLLDHYRHTAAVAMDAAYPYEREHRPQVPPARTPRPALPDPAAALAWLDSELPNLLAAARYATEHNKPIHLLHLSSILHRHLRTRGRYHDAETLHQHALTAARDIGHQTAELDALTSLGYIHRAHGRHEQATDHYQQAMQLARAIGHQGAELDGLVGVGHIHHAQGRNEQATDHYQQAMQLARATGHHIAELDALVGLGHIHRMQGRYEQSTDHYQKALQLARITGHRTGELHALVGLGHIHQAQGRYEQATDRYQQALELARATGDHVAEQTALTGLGLVDREQGRYEQATDHCLQALRLARATGHEVAEQTALTGLGLVHRMQGRHGQAADHYQRLLDLAQRSGNRNYQFEAWQGLGRLHHATGHSDAAVTYHDRALALATELDQPDDQARAHDGLAHAHDALHQTEQARTHWQHALDILTRLGIDRTDDEETTIAAIRAHLTTLGSHETDL
jgi:DNA-binding SARP family transcriptional activator/tetratricopeptide (TPR) repeat protein